MRKIVLYLVCLGLGCSGAVADDRPAIPPGVKYKFMDEGADSAMRAALLERFAKGDAAVADLFKAPCVCAPGYWKGLSPTDITSFKEPVPTHFSVLNHKTGVKDKMDGATLRNPDDLANLAKHFSHDIGLKPTIRRLTTEEINQFWAIYPFDVEEPVYVIENDKNRFVVCLTKGGNATEYSVSWLDNLSAYN